MTRVILPDGSFLQHVGQQHAPYDPVKAHKYYEEHKHLHPRQRHAPKQEPTKGRTRNPSFTVKTASGDIRLSAEQLQKQRVYVGKRVAQITARLHKMRAELREKLAAAEKAERDAKKPKTAAEKAQAARDAKKYREKHKQELKSKSKQAAAKKAPEKKSQTVESLKGDIAAAQVRLKTAVARQRALATAKQNG